MRWTAGRTRAAPRAVAAGGRLGRMAADRMGDCPTGARRASLRWRTRRSPVRRGRPNLAPAPSGVPMIVPVAVRLPAPSPRTLGIPKSASLGSPSELKRTFSGLTSRCRTCSVEDTAAGIACARTAGLCTVGVRHPATGGLDRTDLGVDAAAGERGTCLIASTTRSRSWHASSCRSGREAGWSGKGLGSQRRAGGGVKGV